MSEKKYKFDASPSVPDGYPAEAIFGGMVGEAHIDHGTYLESGWGRSGAVVIIGDGMHPLPDSIRVRFFSYIDDKFYHKESYPLPQERIKELLEKSYKDNSPGEYRYTRFQVSLAPGGWVTVWLSGGLGQIELLSFQADEAPNWDYKRVFPNRNASREEMRQLYMKDMYGFVQREIAEDRVPYDYWKRLSKKYKWKFTTNDPGFEVYRYGSDFINIERRRSWTEPHWLTEPNEKAIPKSLSLFLRHDKDPLRYKVHLYLVEPYDKNNKDEEGQTYQEMTRTRYLMDLFDKFYTSAGDEEVSLMVEFNDAMTEAQVKLKTATKEQVIDGCRLRGIWDSDSSRSRDW